MRDRIELDETMQGGKSFFHSRALLEIVLWVYAVLSALIVTRVIVLLFNVEGRIWIVTFINRLTNFMVWPLERLPGGSSDFPGSLDLADVTLLVFVVLIPLLLIAFGKSPARRQSL